MVLGRFGWFRVLVPTVLSSETTRTDQSQFPVKTSLRFENLSPVDFSC